MTLEDFNYAQDLINKIGLAKVEHDHLEKLIERSNSDGFFGENIAMMSMKLPVGDWQKFLTQAIAYKKLCISTLEVKLAAL